MISSHTPTLLPHPCCQVWCCLCFSHWTQGLHVSSLALWPSSQKLPLHCWSPLQKSLWHRWYHSVQPDSEPLLVEPPEGHLGQTCFLQKTELLIRLIFKCGFWRLGELFSWGSLGKKTMAGIDKIVLKDLKSDANNQPRDQILQLPRKWEKNS